MTQQNGQQLALPSTSLVVNSENDKEILVDALPYLDTNYTETDRQMAQQLIENECRTFRPTKNYLQNMPIPDLDVFLTPTLVKEHVRMSKKQEMPKLDMSRCELSCPSTTGRQGDRTSWRKAIRNAAAQNEHLLLRNMNLQLMEEYASANYLKINKQLENVLHFGEKELRKMREDVMNLHSRRRKSQMEAGEKMKDLEHSWVQMITKNYKMELTCQELDAENRRLAKQAKLI